MFCGGGTSGSLALWVARYRHAAKVRPVILFIPILLVHSGTPGKVGTFIAPVTDLTAKLNSARETLLVVVWTTLNKASFSLVMDV